MVDQIIKKMTREVENCPESSFFGTGIILDVGVKRYFGHDIFRKSKKKGEQYEKERVI